MTSNGCACERLDQIESRMIRTRALLEQTQKELLAIREDMGLTGAREKWLKNLNAAASGEIVPLYELERRAIHQAITLLGLPGASKALGLGKTTLYRKLKEYGWDANALRKEGRA